MSRKSEPINPDKLQGEKIIFDENKLSKIYDDAFTLREKINKELDVSVKKIEKEGFQIGQDPEIRAKLLKEECEKLGVKYPFEKRKSLWEDFIWVKIFVIKS